MPKLRNGTPTLSEPFTVRLSADTLADLDRLAAQTVSAEGRAVSRQSAARMAIVAGIKILTDASQVRHS